MKKTIAVILVLAVSLVLACCAAEEEPSGFNASMNGNTEFNGFNGEEFSLISYRSDKQYFGYDEETLLQDSARSHIAAVEKANDCTIKYMYDADPVSKITLDAYAAMCTADMDWLQSGWQAIKLVYAGFDASMTYLDEYLDLSDYEKYGPINIQESCMADGEFYAASPMSWPAMCYRGNLGSFIIFNEGTVKRLAMPNPRELDENGKWTRDYFFDIFPEFSYNDGDRTVYSLISDTDNYTFAYMGSDGMTTVIEKDGQIVAGYETQQMIETLDWIRKLSSTYKDELLLFTSADGHERFIRGEATMCVNNSQFIFPIAAEMYDFGLVPFPCGPDIEYGKQNMFFSAVDCFSLSLLSNHNDECAKLISDMCEPFEDFKDEESRLNILTSSIFFNDRDARFFANMYRKAQYLYAVVGYYSVPYSFASKFETSTGAELISQNEGKNQGIIDKYILPNYLYIKSVTTSE